MAEDPGVSTLAALIESLRQSLNLAHDSASKITSGIVDVVRTRMYLSHRRGMTQKEFEHGYQSLKKLRLQEGPGVSIVSVEVGTWDDAKTLKAELKQARIDFALTSDKKGIYTLHYKNINEADIQSAQIKALRERFGIPAQEQAEADATEALKQELNQENLEANRFEDQSHIDPPIQPDDVHQSHERAEQAASARAEETERTAPHSTKAHSVTEPVKAEALRQEKYEPLESVIQEAKERARKKNLARAIARERTHTRSNRTKARDYDMGH